MTVARETKHNITTTDGKTIHKKLASNPLKFQPSKKAEEARKPTKRCTRCGRFSNEELCDTHKRTMLENKKPGQQIKQSTSASKTFPTMPSKQTEKILDIKILSDSQSSRAEETPTTADIDPELTVTVEIKYSNSNETELTEISQDNQTPAISSPVGCSTELI